MDVLCISTHKTLYWIDMFHLNELSMYESNGILHVSPIHFSFLLFLCITQFVVSVSITVCILNKYNISYFTEDEIQFIEASNTHHRDESVGSFISIEFI